MRLRSLIQLNPPKSQVAHLPGDTEVTFAPMEALSDGLGGLDTSNVKTLAEVGSGSYSFFADGDLLLAKVTPCFENGKKAIASGLVNGIGFATSEVHVIRPDVRRLHTAYLKYLLSSEHFRAAGIASMTGAGGLRRVSEDAILNYRLPIADLGIQRAITDFLDRETARINQLIEKKQRLMKLLDQRWKATLDAVICGRSEERDENRCVEHLSIDRIPIDWALTPLKHLTDDRRPIMYGIVLPGPNVDEGVLIVKGGDVKPGRLDPDKLCKTTFEIESNYVRSRLRAGDLVISIRGSIGEVEIVPPSIDGANLTQDAARIAPRKGVHNGWLRYALQTPSVFFPLEAKSMGAAVRGINIFDLKRVRVPTPPYEAQRDIAVHLATKEAQIGSLRDRITAHAAMIREFRSALIAAAVTGQIDVAAWGKSGETDWRLDAIEQELAGSPGKGARRRGHDRIAEATYRWLDP